MCQLSVCRYPRNARQIAVCFSTGAWGGEDEEEVEKEEEEESSGKLVGTRSKLRVQGGGG